MPRKTASELDREIADILTKKPACAGIDASGITSTQLERCYLASVMEKAGGSVSEAARLAGLDRTNFRRLLHRYGIR
jgi:transcriptional regulator with GAF, ATPase, and Fis domain